MAKLTRIGTAVSAIALAGFVAGCAAPFAKSGSAQGVSKSKVGLAVRAQAALGAGDLVSAVSFAEQAAENSPQSAEIRTLLGNAYFASGRFASAEGAYRDTLSLLAAQPQVILKLALVQVAQGKNGEALATLEAARGVLDPADHGLALALAGQPNEAIQLLEPAAREQGADSRVRQNLALAYGLAGNWDAARTVAEQDLPGNLVDARIQQWMTFAKPARASDQVASLVGVVPAAADPGQPVRLALSPAATSVAQAAAPVAAPAPVEAPQPEYAAVELPPIPAPAPAVATDVSVAAVAVQAPAEVVTAAAAAAPAPAFVPTPAPRKALARAKARAALGNSKAVVQLGAYKSPERVALAWSQLSERYPALKQYSPVRARFDGPQGTVWRLSIKGFGNQGEAISRCNALRSRGASCFVRSVAGDAPVQFASR